jgi:ABC-2 type transport system ATP-binding protein
MKTRENVVGMYALALSGVSKTFGTHTAVSSLSLAVPPGSLCGFIGPNGSGKTTTLRMILNIILPDCGTIEVLGRRVTSTSRDDVGYLPEERGLYKKMQVGRLLRYYGALKGRTNAELTPMIDLWAERLGLSSWLDKRVDQLSKGMAQKVQFLAAIVSRPRLLVLDEPFSGLDPLNAALVRDAVLELRREGTTVIFSTHDMGTAEQMCDRIVMIFRGRKVLDGTMAEIQAEYGHDTIRMRVSAGPAVLRDLPGVEALTDHGNYQDLKVTAEPQAFLQQVLRRTAVQHFEITRPSLADIFVRIAQPNAQEVQSLTGAGA